MNGRATILVALILAFIGSTAGASEGTLLWQIGQTDHNFREFANAGDIMQYSKAFPKDVHFLVGKSDPAKDFSAVHPGPLDAWGGHRQHPFIIEFELAEVPKETCELRIDLADTHNLGRPTLNINVNGTSTATPLPPGTGDMTLLRPDKGARRTLRYFLGAQDLRAGTNRIELRVTEGAWLLYDAIAMIKLGSATGEQIELQVEPTIFFIDRDGRLLQEFKVTAAAVPSQDTATLEVRVAGATEHFKLEKPTLGNLAGVFYIPPTEADRQIEVTLTAGGQSKKISATQHPQKRWHVFCAPSTHTDIGYTAHQSKVIELHNRNTDLAIELSGEFPLYHWNLESSWAAQVWFHAMPPYRHEELYEAARGSRVGIEASYLNMLTGLCSGEELVRTLYYSARLLREKGVPFASYTLTDAPSHVWSVPSILAGAGIRYISIGSNQTRAPILKQNIHHKAPFWWEGPDGQRVMTWITAGYSQAGEIGLREGAERMRQRVEAYLFWWNNRQDYPYDAMLLHGAYSDNVAIGRDIAESITAYSQRYAYPKVTLCSNDVFFKYIEEHFADQVPTVRGCGGSWWEDGAGSTAVETAINRNAHEDIIAAEAVWAAAIGSGAEATVPQEAFNTTWDHILLYDEHTWGAHNSISEPNSDFVQRQWATKAAFATDAAEQSKRLMDDGLRLLANRVEAPDEAVLVFNPSGRARTAVVNVDIPRDMTLVDDKDHEIPSQVVRSDVLGTVTVAFLASDVPAVGYRTYGLRPGSGKLEAPARFKDNVLENEFYKVVLDPASGGVSSLVDKTTNRELIEQGGKYKLGQLIYGAGGNCVGTYYVDCPVPQEVKFSSPGGAKIEAGARGPVFASARGVAQMDLFPRIEMETILYEHEKRVDFIFRLHKRITFEKEAVYLAFPFAGAEPQFRYEIGFGNVRPNDDQWPGACRDWFSVQRWVTLHTDGGAIAWSPLDTPLITLCDLTPGRWLDELPITNGTIFAYALNNYWFTNYKAGQDGDFVFRYSLTSDASIDPVAASRFGENAQTPLRATRLFAGRQGSGMPASASLCAVEPANVELSVFKPADDGKGLILRLHETAGADTEATVNVRLPGAMKALQCDLVERVQEPLRMADGQIKVKLRANGLATIRLQAAPTMRASAAGASGTEEQANVQR